MLLAQQKVDETKAALAIAYQASTHIEDKGPQVGPLRRPLAGLPSLHPLPRCPRRLGQLWDLRHSPTSAASHPTPPHPALSLRL